jgi:sterol desaturase/sphingolipid hydroxylase (fatty acid hydroxylase superfamily)
MDISPLILAIPVYFTLIVIEFFYQWWKEDRHYRLNDAMTNISCGIVQQSTGLFLRLFSVGVYILVYDNLRLVTIPVNWWVFLILFVLVDFCYYWAHRYSHEISLFWGGHVVHHQSEDYNLSVALRQGSFQVFFTFIFFLPLAFFGFDPKSFVLANALGTLYQFWIHTESIDKMGWVELVFNTPSHHRVHHGRNPKYIDKNHAGVFIIWDKMFGTFQVEEERPTYGITTPLNSWDPIWANFDHFKNLGNALTKVRSLTDAFKILFKKPGWMPSYLGGYISPQEVDQNLYKKFDKILSKGLNIYVFIQYLLVMAYTSAYLFLFAFMDSKTQIIYGVLLLYCIWVCGKLLEDPPWILFAESIKWLTLILVTSLYIPKIEFEAFGLAVILISVVSLACFFILKNKKG